MSLNDQLTQIFEKSDQLLINDSSRIVLMSDCHRGDGSWADSFSRNQNVYFAALTYYYKENFTYIELGDGDELWENKHLNEIVQAHVDVYWLLSKFYAKKRYYAIYGNHDIVKRNVKYVKDHLSCYWDEHVQKKTCLFKDIKVHEGLVLKYIPTGDQILLVHGHQGDLMNDKLWKLSRALVRYIWRPLELNGVNDPTSAAKNYKQREQTERRLIRWVRQEKHMLIAGHTHRPVFPDLGEPLYFNDGSCVHPRCITALEIENGCIQLVKWCFKTKEDGTIYVGREVLDGPRALKECFRETHE